LQDLEDIVAPRIRGQLVRLGYRNSSAAITGNAEINGKAVDAPSSSVNAIFAPKHSSSSRSLRPAPPELSFLQEIVSG